VLLSLDPLQWMERQGPQQNADPKQSADPIRNEVRAMIPLAVSCQHVLERSAGFFFLPRMVGYHDTMIGGGLPKPGNSGKNYNHHDFPEGPL